MTFDNKLSLFIPRVHLSEANEDTIKQVLYPIGLVDRVDLVHKGEFFQAFVHFHVWYDSAYTRQVQDRISDPDVRSTIRCFKDRPTYFILLRNTNPLTKEEVQCPLAPLWCHRESDPEADWAPGDAAVLLRSLTLAWSRLSVRAMCAKLLPSHNSKSLRQQSSLRTRCQGAIVGNASRAIGRSRASRLGAEHDRLELELAPQCGLA